MADNDNQQAPSVNDGASSGQDLAADLKKLAHAVYENRDDEAKWQEFLQQTTDDVIALVSADPSVLVTCSAQRTRQQLIPSLMRY